MKWVVRLVSVAVAVLLPFLGVGDYIIRIVIIAGIYVILASSLNLVTGVAGQVSLGHAAFYGIGAYTSALLALKYGVSFWIGMPVAALFAGIMGLLVGLPSLRLQGGYLAITTLGFNEIVRLILVNWDGLTRGPMGLPGIPHPSLWGWSFTTNTSFYYMILIMVIVTLGAIKRILDSKTGRNFKSLKDDTIAAEAMGVDTSKHKLMAFVMGAVFAGMAGSFYAHYVSYIDPQSFSFDESIAILSMVVLGGMGSLNGAVLGAILMVILPEVLRFLMEYRMVIYGGVIVAMMLIRPQGILGDTAFNPGFNVGRKADR